MKSCEDAFIESVGNLIFDNNAAFDCRYKKLVLNVDEVLSWVDERKVGVVDGQFTKLGAATDRPAPYWPEYLAAEACSILLFFLDHG